MEQAGRLQSVNKVATLLALQYQSWRPHRCNAGEKARRAEGVPRPSSPLPPQQLQHLSYNLPHLASISGAWWWARDSTSATVSPRSTRSTM